eukprot:s24_g21.t2
MGLAEADDYWYVKQSIYGLRESPAAWASFRDKELQLARWQCDVGREMVELRLQQLISDNQVWKVIRADGRNQDALGYLMVYVDDLMIMGGDNVMKSFFGWVSAKWECDDLNVLSQANPIKFLGMELHYVNGGIEVSQEGFVRELLRSHQHAGGRAKTQGPKETLIMSVEEEAGMLEAVPVDLKGKEHLVKEAQRRVGEMLWLSSRSRPDIQYVTSIMSSRITRCPEAVITIGDRLLDYLNETMYERLRFAMDTEEEPQLRTYPDSSFAPSSGRSHGAVAIFFGECPLAWRSSRQPLVALSTAETELMEDVEGAVMTYATKCPLEEVLDRTLGVNLHIDNQAAISLMTTATGNSRTRHLRLRANWIKQKIQEENLKVKHEPGATQRADLGTEPLRKDRLAEFKKLWSFKDRRSMKEVMIKSMNVASWLGKLVMMCQVCGAAGVKEGISTEIPWDLYIVVSVMAIAVIGVWEALKHCVNQRPVHLRALRTKTLQTNSDKLTRNELKELQVLMSMVPEDLSDEQKVLADVRSQTCLPADKGLGLVETCAGRAPAFRSSSCTGPLLAQKGVVLQRLTVIGPTGPGQQDLVDFPV